jgi:hypothetical protein
VFCLDQGAIPSDTPLRLDRMVYRRLIGVHGATTLIAAGQRDALESS